MAFAGAVGVLDRTVRRVRLCGDLRGRPQPRRRVSDPQPAHHRDRHLVVTSTRSRAIRSYQPTLVLGVLQTPAYATVVFTPDDDLSEQEATASVAERMTRWELLAQPSRQWRLIQAEGALRWIVRSHDLMVEQLDRLIEASHLPNVELGVVPLDTVARDVAPKHGFHIYDHESVTFGTETGTALLSDPRRIANYEARFNELEQLAVFGDEARLLLGRLADECRRMSQ